jgi:hypothetical protein
MDSESESITKRLLRPIKVKVEATSILHDLLLLLQSNVSNNDACGAHMSSWTMMEEKDRHVTRAPRCRKEPVRQQPEHLTKC